MKVVHLTTLVSIVILLPCIISAYTQCPADGIVGCRCGRYGIFCDKYYTGEDIPTFRKSNEVYYMVS